MSDNTDKVIAVLGELMAKFNGLEAALRASGYADPTGTVLSLRNALLDAAKAIGAIYGEAE